MTLETDGIDSRYDGGGSDAKRREQKNFGGSFVYVTNCKRCLVDV